MAHFAQIDENNVVIQVVVIDNADCEDDNGNESESVGIAFCQSLFGSDTTWVQTSYNASFRNRYASIGGTWNSSLNSFVDAKPYDSWVFNQTTTDWDPPVPDPSDADSLYYWDESTTSWVEAQNV